MKPIDLRGACPEMPDRYDRMYENTLARLEREQVPVRRKASVALIAALIAALLLAGLAYAASQSRILERLFPSGRPGEAAQRLVTPVMAAKADGPYSFSVDEWLFDGNGLHVEWTAKSASGALTIFTADDIESTSVELLRQGRQESLQLEEFVPLGDSLNGRAASREFHGYTVVTLPEDIGSKPFDVTIRGAFLKPVAPVVVDEDIQANIARPTWIARTDGDQVYLHFASIVVLNADGSRSEEAPDVWKYLLAPTDESSGKERMDAYVKGLAKLGYAQPLSEMELTFTVTPDTAHIHHTGIEGPSTFEFGDRTVTITQADFTAAHTSMEGVMVAKGDATEEDLFKLYYELRPDGEDPPARINSEENSGLTDEGVASVEFRFWGGPLFEAPVKVVLKAFWYPDGLFNEATGEKNVPKRVPEYDIALRLKRVP